MNVLLSSVGRRSYLVEYFRVALAGKGCVVATNSVAETPGMFSADFAEVVPPANSPDFIEVLFDICLRHKVRLLCSLHDWEAPYLAPHRKKFMDAGIIMALPCPEIVDVCLDKYKTWQFSNAIGIPSPKCYIDIAPAVQAIESGELSFPVLLKPRWGQGSLLMKKVYTIEHMRAAFEMIQEELTIDGFGYLAGEHLDRQVLIQQFIKGQEYGVDVVNNLKGDFVTCFVKRKIAMRLGETDAAETVSMPEIEKYCRKISAATKHIGNLDADFFVSEDGLVSLLELNPRFGGGYPFSHMAGANIPAALIAWAEGSQPSLDSLTVKIGVKAYKDIQILYSHMKECGNE